jgi:hypothetical protein
LGKIFKNHNKSTEIFDIPIEITISHRWCGSKNPSSSAPSNSNDDGQEQLQANAMWPCRSGCRRCWTTRAAPTVLTARASYHGFREEIGESFVSSFQDFFLPPLQLLVSRPHGPRIEDQATSTLKTQR